MVANREQMVKKEGESDSSGLVSSVPTLSEQNQLVIGNGLILFTNRLCK
jgi:hypothetical protein